MHLMNILHNGESIEVVEVLQRSYGLLNLYSKVRTKDDRICWLRHVSETGGWESRLTPIRRGDSPTSSQQAPIGNLVWVTEAKAYLQQKRDLKRSQGTYFIGTEDPNNAA